MVSITSALVNEGLVESISAVQSASDRDNAALMCLDYVLVHAIKPGGLDLDVVGGPIEAACKFTLGHIQKMSGGDAQSNVLEAKSAAQALARVAQKPAGKAMLCRQPGLLEALMWMLDNSEPIGKVSAIDPAAAAGQVLAFLYGREEDTALTLPERAVVKVCDWFDVMVTLFSPAMALEPCQGLMEVSVSDSECCTTRLP
jgi:hypothetical protein